jgi:hypothetical protein
MWYSVKFWEETKQGLKRDEIRQGEFSQTVSQIDEIVHRPWSDFILPVRLCLSTRISQLFNSIFLSHQITITQNEPVTNHIPIVKRSRRGDTNTACRQWGQLMETIFFAEAAGGPASVCLTWRRPGPFYSASCTRLFTAITPRVRTALINSSWFIESQYENPTTPC